MKALMNCLIKDRFLTWPLTPKHLHSLYVIVFTLCTALPGLAQDMSFQRLNDTMAVISGSGANILVKQAANGDLIVVDGGLEAYAEITAETIAKSLDLNGFTISLLFNTHWHPEQTGMNRILGPSTRIFAHENTRQWLATSVTYPWDDSHFEALPESALPDESFYHYGDMTQGGTEIMYGYLRQAHTDGDMYVYFPEDNVLHAGGVINNSGWPLMDWWTGGWIGGLANSLEVLLEIANDDTIIVPANGPLMNKAELQAMRDMVATIFQRISEGFRNANSIEDTLNEMPTAEFDAEFGNPETFIRRSHESLIPHYTPDA